MRKDLGYIKGPAGKDGKDGKPGEIGPQGPQGVKGDPAIVNGKSGAEITLGAADIKTASGDTVETSLSKKVSMYSISGVDLNTVTTAGHYRLNGGCTNVPITGGGWEQWSQMLVVHGGGDNTSQVMFIYWTGQVRTRSIKSGTTWTDWISLATATPPQELPLPLEAGYIKADRHACNYSRAQDGTVLVHIAIKHTSGTLPGGYCLAATLPQGYRPVEITGKSVDEVNGVYVNPNGTIAYGLSGVRTALIETLEFRAAPIDPIASQSTPVRMSVPVARKARSATQRDPEKRLMCVVDASGAYVEFVEVTVTYDEEWQTLGALFTPYCYALKDGETLVDSDRPPRMRVHAGDDGLITPVWDLGGKVWLESATAKEIAAWELEHPAPEPTPPSPQEDADAMIVDHEYRLTLLELGVN